MIALAKSISHTEASLGYGWNQEKEAVVIFKNHLIGENPKEIASEFRFIQKLNYNCTKNTISFMLSPTIEDGNKLNEKGLSVITQKFLKRMKLLDHQSVAFCHNDKNHKHIHLYVNRINFNGKAYNDSYIGLEAQSKVKEVARKLGLQTVEDAKIQKLKNSKQHRTEIFNYHREILVKEKVINHETYVEQFKKIGIELKYKYDKSGTLRGFRYNYKGLNLKASEVHRSMSFAQLNMALKKNELNTKNTNEQIRINFRGIGR